MKSNEMLLALSLKHKGDWEKIYRSVLTKEYPSESENPHSDFDYITILDKEYPQGLKESVKPPFVLFYKGNLNLLNDDNIVSVSSSRKIKEEEMKELSNDLLDNDFTYIVGHHTELVRSLVETGKKIIVVLSSGIDKHPQEIVNLVVSNGGLVISEFPQGVSFGAEIAPTKYRIISGISKKTVILHVSKQSGGNVLVSYALQNGKDIFVLPLNYKEDFINNELIYQGAIPLINKGVLTDYSIG